MRSQPVNRISVKGLKVWRLYGILQTLFILLLATGAGVLAYIFDGPLWIYAIASSVVILYGYLFVYLFPKVRWSRWRYKSRESEIELQHGLFIVKSNTSFFFYVYYGSVTHAAGVPDVGQRSGSATGVESRLPAQPRREDAKSVGNVVDPFAMAAHYGVDQVRYFFMREVSFGQDGSYNHEAIVARINADLANDLGNLAQRSLSMIAKQLDGVLPETHGEFTDNDKAILAEADAMLGASRTAMATQQIHQWLSVVWSVVAEANRYFAGEAPWALARPIRRGRRPCCT